MTWKFNLSRAKLLGIVLVLALAVYVATHLHVDTIVNKKPPAPQVAASAGAVKVPRGLDELPQESNFKTIARSNELELKFDATTGHFQVVSLKSGNVWRSYPDPAHWASETQEGVWRTHLRSPLMFRYIDLTVSGSQPKDSNFLEENGTIQDVQTVPNGFRLTFNMPSKQLAVPVEVTLENDSVVTTIVDAGIKEGRLSLVWLRLYPFLGAEHSAGQDGYLFIPDGSGALISYKSNPNNTNRVYQEPLYGQDLSYMLNANASERRRIVMPVFGVKSGDAGFVSVFENGAEYAEVVASPSGVFSRYNWIAGQQDYRATFKQFTNEKKGKFFLAYNKDNRFRGNRSIRYMFLDRGKADYAGMAERYRRYLMETQGLTKIQTAGGKLPMSVNLIGAEREDGLITDRYLKATTTSDAMRIVQRLYGLGVENMVVNYLGWQQGGYSSYGGLLPVDNRLGGESGMKQFIQYAHTLDIPVYLQATYLFNTTGRDGYNKNRNGLRNLGGTVLDPVVSLGFLGPVMDRDIKAYKKMGVDGVTLTELGASASTDYNTNYPASRDESSKIQQELFRKFRDASLDVRGFRSNAYVWPLVGTIDHLSNDYSYDSFSDTAVPFAQMVLHGLIPYTSEYANERQEYRSGFLNDLEFGANPSFLFSSGDPEDLKYAHELFAFNPSFKDWETDAVKEYQLMNEALGDVQNQFIVNHRTLAPGVKETTYENGKRIIVNYGHEPYEANGIVVKPQDYSIVKGGGAR